MFMKKQIFLHFSFFILSSFCFSQNVKIDSLLTILKTAKEDTLKVNILNNLFLQYEFENDEKAKEYLDKAFELSQKIASLAIGKKSLANTYIHLGFFADDKGNYPEALKNYFAALKIYKAIGDKTGEADSYNNIGIIYRAIGNYPESLKNHFAALKIREKIGDKKGIAGSYNNIGSIYQRQGNYTEALKNYFSSLKIKEAIGDKKEIANTYLNIGTTYFSTGNYSEALKNYFACLEIKKIIGDKKGIAASYSGIGNVYYTHGNYTDALKNYFACLEIYESMGGKAGIIQSYINIGNVYTKQKKYIEAEEYLLKSKKLVKKIGYKEYLKEVYSSLMSLDSARGNYKGAYENHKIYILYRDSLDNEETRKKTIQSQMTFDFEKKEDATKAEQDKKDAVAAEEKQKQKIVLILVSCVLLLVFVFAGFVFRSLRVTRKQKHIIELQKHIVEEHQKEITDSIHYAKRIQYALLASDDLLQKHLPEHFVLFKPKDIVSGDFYWATEYNNSFYLAVCDSTGHGVPGAFMSILNIGFLNEAIKEKNILNPNEILNYVRTRLIETISNEGQKDGMDCILIKIEMQYPTSDIQHLISNITYAAANNEPILLREGKIIELSKDKMPVGKGERIDDFTLHNITLQKGDSIILYTDGYADQFGGEKGKKFKYKALNELLLANHQKTSNHQKEILLNKFDKWKGNLEQVDDMLVIGIRI